MKKNNIVLATVMGVAVLIFIGKKLTRHGSGFSAEQIKKRRTIMSKNERKDIEVRVNNDLADMVKQAKGVSTKSGLNENEKRELTNRFKAMSADELELFMDLVPVELCLNRIQKELDKAKAFENAIKTATAGLN